MQRPPRRLWRLLAFFLLFGFGFVANVVRVAGEPWPQWMDGRFGIPMPWGMFAYGISCSAEVVAIVSVDSEVVELGRPMATPGPSEWLWSVDDLWNQFAWFRADSVDWEAVEVFAIEASGLDPERASVRFVVRERRSTDSSIPAVRDVPREEWGSVCR